MAAPMLRCFCTNVRCSSAKLNHCAPAACYKAPEITWGVGGFSPGKRFMSSENASVQGSTTQGASRDPGPLFMNAEVQRLLKKVTTLDHERVFKARLGRARVPAYNLMTAGQLAELESTTDAKVERLLQMPPVVKRREDVSSVITEDKDIDMHTTEKLNFVFTDITHGLPKRARIVTVREPNGTLRHASGSERQRILDMYFPTKDRSYKTPTMFDQDNLERLLKNHSYEFVLDRACVQFEPDEVRYQEVAHRTYEHIAEAKRFNDLRSTRHFGPMTFYFVFYKNIEALLLEMLERKLVDDAADLVRLYLLIHPNCDTAKHATSQTGDVELIRAYAKSSDARSSREIERAVAAAQIS